ncbi:RagB/SusD family nutrient uptake outer membrane protein [Solitalea lacus]|uniref:RagB/SusD family nutrient uptake outer membrane protein n=1 Tax=Solitalea lacus TaxID=2911172 RepID=UPI001EDB3839|nr:RagB/SusD family nutrient uptake outer membrane protein [Solitalea lacus]UKJ06780.1 RagB/SusD family nutrient uptake outer membrane protein [Solitalea lacus]
MKKNKLNYINRYAFRIMIASALTLSLPACHGKLNLEPFDSLNENQVFSDSKTLRNYLNGAYGTNTSGLKNSSFYGSSLITSQNYQGVDLYSTGSGSLSQYIMTANSSGNPSWTVAYSVNFIANKVIEKTVEPSLSTFKGEAHFIRAITLFDLARAYCRPFTNLAAKPDDPNTGLPIVLIASGIQADPFALLPGRATLRETYTQIISDLKEAQNLCPVSEPKTSAINYASKDAATALLARVYLYMGDWDNAINEASKIVSANKYALWNAAELKDIFTKSKTSEEIFTLAFDAGSPNSIFMTEVKSGMFITPNWLNILGDPINSADARKNHIVKVANTNNYRLSKYDQPVGTAFVDVRVLRYAEVILNRAEAYAEKGMLMEAVTDVNALRSKRGLPPFASALQAEVLDEIKKQRRLEFLGEGFAKVDIFRKNDTRPAITGTPYIINEIKPDDFRAVFPIPLAEVHYNKNVKQNPGYGDN